MGIIPYTWSDNGVGKPMHWVNTKGDPRIEAAKARAVLNTPGFCGVLLFWDFPCFAFNASPLREIVRSGPLYREAFEWFRIFWAALAGAPKPRMIVWPYEQGVKYWQMTQDTMAEVINDRSVSHKLPAAVRSMNPYGSSRECLPIWDAWALPLVNKMLYELTVALPKRLLGWSLSCTNYDTYRLSFPCIDPNGNQLVSHSVASGCAPCSYFTPGNFTAYTPPNARDPHWIEGISQLDIIRSCRNKGPVYPWLAWPTFSKLTFGQWRILVHHIAATGVGKILHWCPTSHCKDPAELEFMRKVFAEAPYRPVSGKIWEPIDYNVDALVTKDIVTPYEEFRAAA